MKVLSAQLTNERGIVLVISLLIIALLLVGGIGAIVSMQTDFKSSGNLRAGTQAFYIADAGINHARQQIGGSTSPTFSCLLAGSCGPSIVTNSFYGGTYTVTSVGTGTNPDRIQVRSVGTGLNNATATIEAWFRRDPGRPPRAIETDKKLEIDDNAAILGICGGAHANKDLKADGNPAVQMANGLTSSEKVKIDGTPCIGSAGCANSPQPDAYVLDTSSEKSAYESANKDKPTYTLPPIKAADYGPLVAAMESAGSHYILNNDGTATTGGTCETNGFCSGGTSATVPAGWSFSGGKWKVTGTSAANGVFYSETEVEIPGSPGTEASPWQATIISQKKIDVSGSPHIKPYPSSSEALKNHLLVAGDHVKIDGNMRADYAGGAILTEKKIEIKGNTTINGFILALDDVELEDNARITYNCDFGCLGPGCPPPPIVTVSWAQKF